MIRGIVSTAAALLFVSSLAAAQAQQGQNQAQTQGQTQSQAASQTQAQKHASSSTATAGTTAVAAQAPVDQSADSLADAARKAREQRGEQPKRAKVWDNDSLEAMAPLGSSSVTQQAKASNPSDKAEAAKPTTPSGGDEASWRKKFSDARDKLDKDQQDLTLLQRELGDLSVQYYTDPTKSMQQGYSQSDLTKQREKIDDKQKEIDADKQAITELEDALRQAGGDPGWAR